MVGIFVALATTVCWSFSIFAFTEGSRRIGANAVNHFRLVVATLLLTVFGVLLIDGPPSTLFTSPTSSHYFWLGCSGIIGLALGDHFNFSGFAILGARLSSALTTFAPIAALVGGYLLLGETLNLPGMLGILITIAGILVLILTRPGTNEGYSEHHGSFAKGILNALAGATCQGIGLVLAKKGLNTPGPKLHFVQAAWIRMLIGTVAIYTLTILTRRFWTVTRPILSGNKAAVGFTLFGAVMGPVIGVSLSMLAITYLKVSVAQTIFSLLPVTVMPIAVFYYKERVTFRSLLGALMAILGVVILVWRENLADVAGF
ncbi:MAG: DMT family transporter [Flavobacteriales bacterium]|nr:DMT family transporter [Flavobacteriales bacterium]MCB9447845.1 DMT family transporter [Flavobacteriales bacterium]